MKRIFFVIIILFFYQIQFSFAKQRELNKGTAVVFGADVLLRDVPSTQGSILDVIPIASKIEIIDKASLLTKIGNTSDYWYKVKYNETEGFIWGPLIADYYYETDLDKDKLVETFMILNLSKGINDEGYSAGNSRIEFRVARNGQLINEHKRLTNYNFSCDTIVFENLDLVEAKLNVLRLKYGFAGETSGSAEQFFRLNNDNLDSLFTVLYKESEGGYVSYGKIVFANEKDGIKNGIVINYKFCNDITDCDDEHGKPCKWEYAKDLLLWDGKVFTLKK